VKYFGGIRISLFINENIRCTAISLNYGQTVDAQSFSNYFEGIGVVRKSRVGSIIFVL
jgi:hypothetical protein